MNKFLVIIFFSISYAYAMIDPEHNYVPGGFGNHLTLKDSLTIFVPNTWEVQAPRSVLDKKVSWVGDIGWFDILSKISKDHGIDINLNKRRQVITLLNSDPTKLPKSTLAIAPRTNIKYTHKSPLKSSYKLPTLTQKKTNHKQAVLSNENTMLKKSFFDTLKLKTVALFTDNFTTKKPINKLPLEISADDSKLMGELFKNLGLKVKLNDVSSTHSKTDNTNKFSFSYEDLTKPSSPIINTFMVFNGSGVYSPILVYPADMEIAKDWYSKNYLHPALSTRPLIKPISSTTTQHQNNFKKRNPAVPLVIKTLPSFLERKEFMAETGLMLSEVVRSWSESEGIEVVWEPLTDFKITKQIRFFSNYLDSIKSLLIFYNSTSSPLQTRFFLKNKTLLVQDLQVIFRKQSL